MKTQSVYVGVDVSAAKLWIAADNGRRQLRSVVANDAAGHRTAIAKLRQLGGAIAVGLEATGNYGLDFSVALHAAGFRVMVINPRAVAQFAKALLQRSKADEIDAEVILAYVQRMPFEEWTPPSAAALELRTLSRYIHGLKKQLVEEKNRLHAAESVSLTPRIVVRDLKRSIAVLEKRLERLEDECLEIITTEESLLARFKLLVASVGYGQTSAIRVLAELAVLPSDMTPRQWVAHAGLDPRRFESGTSVLKPDRISKAGNRYLRAALYLPAVTAIRCDPHVKRFSERLEAHGKKPLQAQVAVMRKMLHSIHAMFRTGTAFDGAKFSPQTTAAPVIAGAA
jgi:transposase